MKTYNLDTLVGIGHPYKHLNKIEVKLLKVEDFKATFEVVSNGKFIKNGYEIPKDFLIGTEYTFSIDAIKHELYKDEIFGDERETPKSKKERLLDFLLKNESEPSPIQRVLNLQSVAWSIDYYLSYKKYGLGELLYNTNIAVKRNYRIDNYVEEINQVSREMYADVSMMEEV